MDEVSKSEFNSIINLLLTFIIAIALIILIEYGINIKKIYPKWVLVLMEEPLVRFTLYVLIYLLACVSPLLAIILALIVVLIHIDIINLTKTI
jgi:hypothetical protein